MARSKVNGDQLSSTGGAWASWTPTFSNSGGFEILFKGSVSSITVLFYDNTGSTCTNGYLYVMGGSYESA